ncbi:ester cyclase [Pseudarthrobacter sp. O4]|uniref:ester cyclase n=1 Tax=Pseudarthrobacter sp. O4 TaxID=3418417 RepID=UPI003CF111D9
MSIADVERIDDQGMAAWDSHDAAGFVALLADVFTFSDISLPEPMNSPDQVKAYMETWFTAFPDMRVTTTNRVLSESQVAAEVAFTGIHTGPLAMGGQQIPATGRAITGTGTYFASIRDGKIISFRAHPDAANLMGQLGLLPGT